MPHPDQKYIDALLTNDLAVLEEIYEKFSGKIKTMITQNYGSGTDAADVFQSALLSIYQKARKNELVLSCPFEMFLYVVCKNKWYSILKKRREIGVTFFDIGSYSIDEDCFMLAEECRLENARTELVREKINELGGKCRELLILNWSGKSLSEIAEAMQLDYSYVRKKKSECMAKLILTIRKSSQYNLLKW